MSENVTAKDLPQNFSEAPAERGHKAESVSSSSSVPGRDKRIFGRKKSVHHLLGGGKCISLFICS